MAKPSLFKSTKLKRLMKLAGITRATAVGHLECLWHAQYERSTAVIGDSDDVELAAEWEGDAGKLTKALATANFIERVAEQMLVYQVHDFFDHCPEYVRKRHKRQEERLNKELEQKAADVRPPDGGKRQTTADNGGYPHPSPSHPIPSHPNTAACAAVSPDADMFAPAKVSPDGPPTSRPTDPAASTTDGATATRPPQPTQPRPASERIRPTGAHHELIDTFCTGWQARYGAPYAFNAGKDGRHVKWILDVLFHDLAEAKRIVNAYLQDEDAWLAERAHPLGQLISQFNKYRAAANKPAAQGVRRDNASRPTTSRAGEYAQPPKRTTSAAAQG